MKLLTRLGGATRWHVPILLALCALLYLPKLGDGGLAYTEGHRAIPAYEMLDSGEWLVPHMFGRPYLRKPPGMPWAIAASSEIFGMTEFAARLVSALSATGMVLVAYGFARSWFGTRFALSAGIAHALWPLLWESSRSAEIEALNNFCTQVSVLTLVHLSVRGGRGGWRFAPLLALALFGAASVKGPASAPVLIAAFGAAFFLPRPARRAFNPALIAGVVVGAVAITALFIGIATRSRGLDTEPVTQSVSEFMWSADRAARIVGLAPTGFLYALPVSLAILFPLSFRARGELGEDRIVAYARARALSFACLGAIGVYTLLGVSNPRYVQPAFVPMTPLVAYFMLGFAGVFRGYRANAARLAALGHPLVWGAGLAIGFVFFLFSYELPRRATSLRDEGSALADAIPPGSEVWADQVIEARPELLHYAEKNAGVVFRWGDQDQVRLAIRSGKLGLIRTDESETGQEHTLIDALGLDTLHEGDGHRFGYALVRRKD